jgi:hypothetical protein
MGEGAGAATVIFQARRHAEAVRLGPIASAMSGCIAQR